MLKHSLLLVVLIASMAPDVLFAGDAKRPNIVVILADDLGYGDVQCYNPQQGKIRTPQLDALAAQGMKFTDAHASCAVCTPTRYSLLTGRYHWRTRLQSGIVRAWEDPLIAKDRLTVAGLLKQGKYHTACIGKWHLGWDWPMTKEQEKFLPSTTKENVPDTASAEQLAAWKDIFSKPIGGGPVARGFDEYFGTDVPNWPPYCFIENDRTMGIPTEMLPAELMKGGLASIRGPALPDWKLEGVLPAITDRACDYIKRRAKAPEPFFLYFSMTSPHTPVAVNAAWKGKSGLGPFADFVMETDAAVGRVLDALQQSGAAGNTLVIFTSDNGSSQGPGSQAAKEGHAHSGPHRGYKFDVYDGGHRVPFIVRWPGVVKPASTCAQTICSVDLFATCAEISGVKVPATAGEDSASLLPLFKGGTRATPEAVVHHGASGAFAIRQGKWKFIFMPGPPDAADKRGELYDLEADPAEATNVQDKHPEVIKTLTALMEKYIADGRSTPGPVQKNDAKIQLWKRK